MHVLGIMVRNGSPIWIFRTAMTMLAASAGWTATPVQAAEINLYAAGSLKAALTDVAKAFEEATGGKSRVNTTFGASGLLRERIENGDAAHVFASANMGHPGRLKAAGMSAGNVKMFARNQLCAIAKPGLAVTSETLLDVMLDEKTRLGTSTPKADPSGDYAFALFAKAEALAQGAKAALEAKALKLTGGPDSEKPPEGRNTYGWVMSENKADVFLTYCTNAALAKKDTLSLQIIEVPEALSVGAEYGLVVLKSAPEAAGGLAEFILGPDGQAILAAYGFGKGDAAHAAPSRGK